MRMMRFSSLYLLSVREKRGLKVSFSPTVTILRGSNGFGKSAIVKSLYDAFGATPHKIDSAWKSARVAALVHFTIDDEPYTMLKTGDRYSLFDKNDYRLIETSSISSELSPFLADLFDFRLVMANREKNTIVPPPAYIFAPFYVDQDQGWAKPWDSFIQMYLPDSKRALSNYHTGLRPNAYYIALANRDKQRAKLNELQLSRNDLRRALEEVRGLVDEIALNYDVHDFENEVEILIAKSSELNIIQSDYRDRLSTLSNERALWIDQQKILRVAMAEMKQSVSLASTQPESIDCPTCGQHYDNSMAARFGLISQFDELFDAYQEGEKQVRDIEIKIKDARSKTGQISIQIEQIDAILDSSREDTTLGQIISAQGRNETTNLLREKIQKIDILVGEALQELRDAEDLLKRSLNAERSKQITDHFDMLRSEYAKTLDVRLDYSSHAISSPQLARGSEGPRGLVSYYYAILQTAREYGSSTFCPIVVDAPNQQGQDAKHLPEILQFLIDQRPRNSQVIIATEETFGMFEDNKIVDVGAVENQVLLDSEFVSVSEHFRPYLGQLL